MKINGVQVRPPPGCRYYCKQYSCYGSRHGLPVEDDGSSTGIALGGNGRAPAGEGLLCVYLACVPWSAAHGSRGDCTILQGISKDSMQLYMDELRRMQARLNIEEQKQIVFKRGDLVEWDETGIRSERVKCNKHCSICTDCQGYRLLWNRWIMGVQRGNRSKMVVYQLPWKTSAAGGGGVPLSDAECDSFCPPHLSPGVICFTDGAPTYEAFAAGQIVCSPNCERKDCLKRARQEGRETCSGLRERIGRERFKQLYQKLGLSHGVVSHTAEEWAVVKEVRVWSASGRSRIIELKHGTEVVDGAWSEVKRCYPNGIKSSDHDRIAEYVNAWAWRARRHGHDMFREMGKQCRRGRS